MLSFLREFNGRPAIVADPRYATGSYVPVASRTHQQFDVSEAERDLLPAVLAEKKSRFIPDSASDAQCDTKLFRECGIVSQYVVPIATESLLIGTIQIDLGSQVEKPETACSMFDALGAHLSLAIERHRNLARLDALDSRLIGQARFIAFNLAATRVTHELNHSVSNYLIKLAQATRHPEIRMNKAAMDFLKDTRKFVEQWYTSLEGQMRIVEATDEAGLHSLRDLVKEAIEDWLPRARRRKCHLVGDCEAKCGKVAGRRGELREMLACLINNAIEANARKVTIRIKQATQISPMMPAKEYAVIEIADDGDGVAPRYRENIFEFGWTSKRRGHGVGLAVVKVLAGVLGGKLELCSSGKSAGEKETRFRLSIPIFAN
jgi:signal transduction histidine kinase